MEEGIKPVHVFNITNAQCLHKFEKVHFVFDVDPLNGKAFTLITVVLDSDVEPLNSSSQIKSNKSLLFIIIHNYLQNNDTFLLAHQHDY